MSTLSPQFDDTQRSSGKGWIVSLSTHIVVLALLCIPFIMMKPTPPPEFEGVLVSLGLPDEGQGMEMPKGEEAKPQPQTPAQKVKVETPPAPAKPVKSSAPSVKQVTTNQESPVTTKSSEQVKQQQAQAEANRKAQQAAQAEANRKAQEAAQAQADYNNSKKSYGSLLGTGSRGNTGKAGSQGDPNGDPKSNILEGITTGSGRVGGGLGSRGLVHEPQIEDKVQETGRVVINVCVDPSGKVIKAEYTQKGSTTTSSSLREIARKAALKFKFTQSEITEQCGTITVDFKLKG